MARKNFTKKTIAMRFQHAGGRCEGIRDGKRCNAVLKPGNWECDHNNPDGLTGNNSFANARALCLDCHYEKTNKHDKPAIAKAQRREYKHIAPAQKSKFLAQGFRPAAPQKTASKPLRKWAIWNPDI